MKNLASYLCFILAALILTACNTTRTISIEVAQPAKQELPASIQTLLLVNRTADSTYSNLSTDSLQRIFYRKNFRLDTTILDSQAVDTMLHAIGQLLYESGRYDYVIPEQHFLPHHKNAFFTDPMSWEEAEQLCETYHTDAVLSIDKYSTEINTEFNKESIFDPERGGFRDVFAAQMKITYSTLVKIYAPKNKRVVLNEFFRDTLEWNAMDISIRSLFNSFTSVKQGLTESSIALALDLSDKIAPNWHREQRIIYTKGHRLLEEAATFVDANNWEEARKRWESLLLQNPSKNLASKAQFNLAIAAELDGDIDKAIEWGVASYKTQFRQTTYSYLKRLKYRKQELKSAQP